MRVSRAGNASRCDSQERGGAPLQQLRAHLHGPLLPYLLAACKFGAHRVAKREPERDGHLGLGVAFALCPVQRVAVAVSPRLFHQ